MDKYYYLVSQLPFLIFDKKPPIDREQFLSEAEKWLSASEIKILLKADMNDFSHESPGPDIMKEYKDFEKHLRGELAKWRKARKNKSEYKLPVDMAGIDKGTPLDIERKLLFSRWAWIENKEEGHYFDLDFLLMYFIKLQILERLFTFDVQKGKERFMLLCESALKDIKPVSRTESFSTINHEQ